ncbi:MAG TPA: GNAT family N-acetyltransferase [Anaerolineales bacterium]|jgi:RimJ/RimL family protein N-acetyltransferase|nr:GNAT family N-acetyltransferase [Anaerolineales bacterium]
MKPPEKFETERLILRRPRLDDAIAIFSKYAQDREVTRYLTWQPHKNIEETHSIVELMLKLWDEGKVYTYIIALKDLDSAIGTIAMQPNGFKVEIGYALARSYWGKGYMTEAARVIINWLFQQPDVYRVFAACDIENSASARVLEKAGMTREGILHRSSMHPNVSDEPRDSYIYAIVK